MSSALDMFRALADPSRLRIIALLRHMELSVGELAQVLGQSQPRVSRHIKILCDAHLAARRKEGSWVFLTPCRTASADSAFALIDVATDIDGEDHWAKADAARLAAVREDRMRAAERYFAEKADHWDAIRSLHVAESEVETAILQLLGNHNVGRLVDLGTGTGRMPALLGSAAASIVALDRSPEMLRLARARLEQTNLPELKLLQADVSAVPLPDRCADTVVIHQLLHYLPAPEGAIAEAARILDEDGRLLVADFAPHDREELRAQDAHARLGFADAQMNAWFGAADMMMEHMETLQGGALTVKLWLGRKTCPAQNEALNG